MSTVIPAFTQATDRGPSPGLWSDAPTITELRDNPTLGWFVDDDFCLAGLPPDASALTVGNYRQSTATSSPIAIRDAGVAGGAYLFGADGDNEQAILQSAVTSFFIQRSTAATLYGGGKLWFEARMKINVITALTCDFFLGLMDNTVISSTVPLSAAGVLSTTVNGIGFLRGEGASADSGVVDTVHIANSGTVVTTKAAAVTLVADTFVKLGFVYDPVLFTVTYYKNGVALADTTSCPTTVGTTFPNDVAMSPILACVNGSTKGTATLDWWRCIEVPVDNVT